MLRRKHVRFFANIYLYEVLIVVIVQEEETTGVQAGGPNLQEDHRLSAIRKKGL